MSVPFLGSRGARIARLLVAIGAIGNCGGGEGGDINAPPDPPGPDPRARPGSGEEGRRPPVGGLGSQQSGPRPHRERPHRAGPGHPGGVVPSKHLEREVAGRPPARPAGRGTRRLGGRAPALRRALRDLRVSRTSRLLAALRRLHRGGIGRCPAGGRSGRGGFAIVPGAAVREGGWTRREAQWCDRIGAPRIGTGPPAARRFRPGSDLLAQATGPLATGYGPEHRRTREARALLDSLTALASSSPE